MEAGPGNAPRRTTTPLLREIKQMLDWIYSTPGMITNVVILLALIGLFFFMKNRQSED